MLFGSAGEGVWWGLCYELCDWLASGWPGAAVSLEILRRAARELAWCSDIMATGFGLVGIFILTGKKVGQVPACHYGGEGGGGVIVKIGLLVWQMCIWSCSCYHIASRWKFAFVHLPKIPLLLWNSVPLLLFLSVKPVLVTSPAFKRCELIHWLNHQTLKKKQKNNFNSLKDWFIAKADRKPLNCIYIKWRQQTCPIRRVCTEFYLFAITFNIIITQLKKSDVICVGVMD